MHGRKVEYLSTESVFARFSDSTYFYYLPWHFERNAITINNTEDLTPTYSAISELVLQNWSVFSVFLPSSNLHESCGNRGENQ